MRARLIRSCERRRGAKNGIQADGMVCERQVVPDVAVPTLLWVAATEARRARMIGLISGLQM